MLIWNGTASGGGARYHLLCPPDVTDVTIANLPARQGAGLVTWNSTSEQDILEFNLVNLRQGGNPIQLNPVPIPCQVCVTGLGAHYEFLIAKHKSGKDVFVEAVHLDGRRELFGPAIRQ